MHRNDNEAVSRQRIEAALAHHEPDRIPVDLGASESSGIHGITYNRLKHHLGLNMAPTRIYDLSQMIAKVDDAVLDTIGADALALLIEPRAWQPFTLMDDSPCEVAAGARLRRCENGDLEQLAADGTVVARCPKGAYYLDTVHHPLADVREAAELKAYGAVFATFDRPTYNDEDYADLRAKARHLYETTGRALVGNLWVHVFAAGQILRGFTQFMMDLAADKPLAHAVMDAQVEAYMDHVARYVEAVGEYCSIIQVNDDLGTQHGLQVSVEMYREMIRPHHARLWGEVKKLSGKPLLLHSCGSIRDLLPDLIEMGVDAVNPVQVTAAGMDSAELKREFGRELVFWGGGCDTQGVLARGTPQQVKDEVRWRCDDLAPGGGFVFCQVHNIQPDVPVENVMAMYEALSEMA